MRRPVPPMHFAIGVCEVTNAQYHAFMVATGYRPVRLERFRSHWGDEGAPRAGTGDAPVTHV